MDLDSNGSAVESRSADTHVRDESFQKVCQIKICREGCIKTSIEKLTSETGVVFHILHEVLAIAGTVISEHVKEFFIIGILAEQFEKGPGRQKDLFTIALIDHFIGIEIFYRM